MKFRRELLAQVEEGTGPNHYGLERQESGEEKAQRIVDDHRKTIYIVDLFWKKTNKVSLADLHRVNHRVRQLKSILSAGGHPWESSE